MKSIPTLVGVVTRLHNGELTWKYSVDQTCNTIVPIPAGLKTTL